MITNHSAGIYSLRMASKYHMNDFKEVKTHKKTGAIYSSAETHYFKRVFIDTELSTAFRHEVWIGDIYYSVEVPIVSYSLDAKKMNRLAAFNVNFKVIKLEDNFYTEFSGNISDDKNFKLKEGALTQNYMIEYAKEVFDFHKEEIVDMVKVINNETKFGLETVSKFGIIRIYKEDFISDMFLP